MSTKARNPNHFPRMKVRGRRNRWKNHIYEYLTTLRANPIPQDNGSVKFDVHPEGSHHIVFTQHRNGFTK